MRFPRLTALGVAGALVLSLGACSKSNDTSTANSSTTAAKSDSGDKSTTTKKESSGDDKSTTTKKSSSDDSMPNLGNLGDCMNVAVTYGGLFLNILGGNSADVEKAKEELEKMKSEVPEEIQGDLDVIASGLTPDKNIMELGEFMDSEEFKTADANIQKYLDENCS